MRRPEIAVVIPTRGRETRLAFALDALAVQTLPTERFEVVVVRDGDASGPLAGAPEGLRLRSLIRPGVAGPTAKRNHGWWATAAPLVAFTDDDCRPAPDWLERLLGAAAGPEMFLQGRTEPDPDERGLLHGLARSQEIVGPTPWFETCNMAYPRALLERLGGFDERFEFGGEDTDLGQRALGAGARAAYVGDAVVWHAVIPRALPRALREATGWTQVPAVVARHPQLRAGLYRGMFWSKGHALILLALAGVLALPRSRALAALAALPYLNLRFDCSHRNPRGVLRQLAGMPSWMAVDAVEVAHRVPAAIRHRVLVL